MVLISCLFCALSIFYGTNIGLLFMVSLMGFLYCTMVGLSKTDRLSDAGRMAVVVFIVGLLYSSLSLVGIDVRALLQLK